MDVIDCSSGGILGSATAATKTLLPRVPGFQLPFAESVRKEAGIMTMAVGLILTPQQAEEALQAGRADLIAIGREALYDPNWPLHAARRSAPTRNSRDGRSSTAGGSRGAKLAAESWECANEDDPHFAGRDGEAHRALRARSSRCRSRTRRSRRRRATSSIRASFFP